MTDAELLALHRELVATPSVSGEEAALCTLLAARLEALGVATRRVGDSLLALAGHGPLLALDTHLDTVPPAPGWTRDPFLPVVEQGRVTGLGSNDAKASVAAMTAAFLRLRPEAERLGVTLALLLAAGEETGGGGTSELLAALAERGLHPAAAIVGEPTGLDLAVAQKGLLLLELTERGDACHAAHARALGARNPLRALARDLLALDGVEFGPEHPLLGPVTLEPTVVRAGGARNAVPAEARCVLDVRTNPGEQAPALVARLQAAVEGRLTVSSERLRPVGTDPAEPLVTAALAARPAARVVGSRTVSDMVFFAGVPVIKVGPGDSERSHTADEFVLEAEIADGARFYEGLVRVFAARVAAEVDA